MLIFNNSEDIPEMMQYHRTRDMIRLMTYFPKLSPIRNLTVVKSLEDYNKNYDYCKNLSTYRNDTLITKPSMKSIEGRGINHNAIEILEKIKKIDCDGVLVLFDLCHKLSERYERYAGISVGINLGVGIVIEAVGKGFDGREVSKGISIHERYYIPWFDIRKCNIDNFKSYRTYIISNDKYQESRKDRVEFLLSIGIPKEKALENIPDQYIEIPDFIWSDVITNLIKKLEKMQEELKLVGLNEFVINGSTEGKQFLPWQLFDKNR